MRPKFWLFAMLLGCWLAGPLAWAGSPSVAVRTAQAKQQKLTETITAFGEVKPAPKAATTRDARYAAFVRRLYVSLGEPVSKGDPLVELRTAPPAHAAYMSAAAQVRFAKRKLAHIRSLLKQNLTTRDKVDSAEQALQSAKTQLAKQKALGTNKKTVVIKAPFTGVVTALPIQPGNEVQSGTKLFQLGRRDRLQVALGIEPDEIARISEGMPVSVQPLFAGGGAIQAKVEKVSAMVNPTTHLVNAIVAINGAQARRFLPGTRVQGTIKVTAETALAVPQSAVLRDKKGTYLFVVRHGHAHRVNVKTGLETNGMIGVSGALTAGEPVVVSGNYELSDGMAVRKGH